MSPPRTDNRSAAAPILIAVLIVAVLPATYAAGYFWLGDARHTPCGTIRRYPHRWEAVLFKPAALVEKNIRGIQTLTTYPGESY
jgi:hypothetical protein